MYVAVKGGEKAIAEAHRLLAEERRGDVSVPELSLSQIKNQMRLAVARVMSEGSLYSEDLAAIAIKQAQGDLQEAVFLLRAYRTTLPRFGVSDPMDTSEMILDRRISATWKDLPGGQVLGATYDYTHRLLDLSLAGEGGAKAQDELLPDEAAENTPFSGDAEPDGRDGMLAGHMPRAMAVLDPLKVIIDNYPEEKTELIENDINPSKPELGKSSVSFSKEIYIEKTDFSMEPPKGFFRLCPEREVRLKGAYYLKFASVDKNEDGSIAAVHCTYDPESRGGETPDGRKVKGTLHWVDAGNSVDFTANIYDRLFNVENPSNEVGVTDFTENLNPDSKVVLTGCKIDRAFENVKAGDTFQFMRQGYFCADKESEKGNLIFNRTVALKDSFNKKK